MHTPPFFLSSVIICLWLHYSGSLRNNNMVYVETSRTKKKTKLIINHITFFEEFELLYSDF